MTMETSKYLHFHNCTSNCSNSSRVPELSRTLSNPCSQKIELNNPALQVAWYICIGTLQLDLAIPGCATAITHKEQASIPWFPAVELVKPILNFTCNCNLSCLDHGGGRHSLAVFLGNASSLMTIFVTFQQLCSKLLFQWDCTMSRSFRSQHTCHF